MQNNENIDLSANTSQNGTNHTPNTQIGTKITLESVKPLPKIRKRDKPSTSVREKGKSRIYTDSPEKQLLEEKEKNKAAKNKSKKTTNSKNNK